MEYIFSCDRRGGKGFMVRLLSAIVLAVDVSTAMASATTIGKAGRRPAAQP